MFSRLFKRECETSVTNTGYGNSIVFYFFLIKNLHPYFDIRMFTMQSLSSELISKILAKIVNELSIK